MGAPSGDRTMVNFTQAGSLVPAPCTRKASSGRRTCSLHGWLGSSAGRGGLGFSCPQAIESPPITVKTDIIALSRTVIPPRDPNSFDYTCDRLPGLDDHH